VSCAQDCLRLHRVLELVFCLLDRADIDGRSSVPLFSKNSGRVRALAAQFLEVVSSTALSMAKPVDAFLQSSAVIMDLAPQQSSPSPSAVLVDMVSELFVKSVRWLSQPLQLGEGVDVRAARIGFVMANEDVLCALCRALCAVVRMFGAGTPASAGSNSLFATLHRVMNEHWLVPHLAEFMAECVRSRAHPRFCVEVSLLLTQCADREKLGRLLLNQGVLSSLSALLPRHLLIGPVAATATTVGSGAEDVQALWQRVFTYSQFAATGMVASVSPRELSYGDVYGLLQMYSGGMLAGRIGPMGYLLQIRAAVTEDKVLQIQRTMEEQVASTTLLLTVLDAVIVHGMLSTEEAMRMVQMCSDVLVDQTVAEDVDVGGGVVGRTGEGNGGHSAAGGAGERTASRSRAGVADAAGGAEMRRKREPVFSKSDDVDRRERARPESSSSEPVLAHRLLHMALGWMCTLMSLERRLLLFCMTRGEWSLRGFLVRERIHAFQDMAALLAGFVRRDSEGRFRGAESVLMAYKQLTLSVCKQVRAPEG
jgi:hypothetical protein